MLLKKKKNLQKIKHMNANASKLFRISYIFLIFLKIII